MNLSVRAAAPEDAVSLFALNEKFNGAGCTSLELLKESLWGNDREVVFIAVLEETVVGFCCVQLFRSLCYRQNYAEITELFVEENSRRKGVASALMRFAENYFEKENIGGFQLFTGGGNFSAQAFYRKLGYQKTDEIMYRKRRI